MKKIKNWRSTRLTRAKSRTQERALLERAMALQSNGPSGSKPLVLWVFINDFTDSDNQAAGLVWAKFLVKYPELKGIYIAEPRHVDLGYYTTSAEFNQCIRLVNDLRPKLTSGDQPIKTVLAGKLTEDIINSSTIDGRPLTEEERNLLGRCIKPEKNKEELNAAKEDAIRHAKLLVTDFLSTMQTDTNATFDTYIDHKCLDKALESPINLKTHYHEELVFRTAQELKDFRTITEKSLTLPEKAVELRAWYDRAITRKLKDFEDKQPWRDLTDYQHLFEEMKQYDRVIVFGGCSLTILQEILEQNDSLSEKVEYYQQGGTFDPGLNILGNPLNFALNLEAAEFVFRNAGRLAKLRLIPTDTTKKIEFTLQGLTSWSLPIGLHSLGFYGKVDIWDLVTQEELNTSSSTKDIVRCRANLVFDSPKYKDPSFRAYKVVMADLSAYLMSFTDAFKEYGDASTREMGVKLKPAAKVGRQMILEKDEASPIKALILDLPEDQKTVLVENTFNLVEHTIETGSSSFKS